jgi:hypothetical protein
MSKAPLKMMKNKRQADIISVDARMTADRKCFSLRLEGGKPALWSEYLHMVMQWAHEELQELKVPEGQKAH